jgi:hypothetical protein
MKMYIYKMKYADGFAPNPFHGYCTLATCKPDIRRVAHVGDLIVGLGGKLLNANHRIIYYMYVDEALSFCDYWADERFAKKRPNRQGSDLVTHGDNIYHQDPEGKWMQEISAHRINSKRIDRKHLKRDTKTDRVLIGQRFAFWGSSAPVVPEHILRGDGKLGLPETQGYRCNYAPEFLKAVEKWLSGLGQSGCCGMPIGWR